jgi:hypothetical protein
MTPHAILSHAPPGTPPHAHSPCPVFERSLRLIPGTQDGVAGARYWEGYDDGVAEPRALSVIVLDAEIFLKGAHIDAVPVGVLACLYQWVSEQMGRKL